MKKLRNVPKVPEKKQGGRGETEKEDKMYINLYETTPGTQSGHL